MLGPVVLQSVAQHDDPWLLDVRAHALVCHILAADQPMHHCAVLWGGSSWHLLHLWEACRTSESIICDPEEGLQLSAGMELKKS